jgi:hypothetical protein
MDEEDDSKKSVPEDWDLSDVDVVYPMSDISPEHGGRWPLI